MCKVSQKDIVKEITLLNDIIRQLSPQCVLRQLQCRSRPFKQTHIAECLKITDCMKLHVLKLKTLDDLLFTSSKSQHNIDRLIGRYK